jgi:CBS domain containing-hemolysin-like protein
MTISASWWLFFNILSTFILAFFSMAEMACVSFNKVRLQYYYSKGHTRAVWLNYLLHNPARLFGTTLIMVNLMMVIGSECSRQFHTALGLNPDLSPLSQILFVVVLGELAPIFAARKYPENVAMITVPVVYFTAKLMTPFLWIITGISKLSNALVGGKEEVTNFYINQEELQKLVEEQDDSTPRNSETENFETISASIFKLNEKDARQVMQPLNKLELVPANATVFEAKRFLSKTKKRFIPIYHKEFNNVIGIVLPRDLLRAPDNKRLRDYHRPPWFITQYTKTMQILKQFKSNNQNVAIVLDDTGRTIGLISLDDIMEEIFGKSPTIQKEQSPSKRIIDRTFPATTTIQEFNQLFDILLSDKPGQTFEQLIIEKAGYIPEEGETVYIEPLEITIKDASLREIKTISIKTL